MNIKQDAKKIIQHFLEKVIRHGSLTDPFYIQYGKLAEDLGLGEEGYCRVCCQYLNGIGCLHIIRKEEDNSRLIELTAKAVDFLETP